MRQSRRLTMTFYAPNTDPTTNFLYEYTGVSVFSGTPDGDWVLTLKTGGTLNIISLPTNIDIFLVGGGGNGKASYTWSDNNYGTGTNFNGGNGGNGAYIKTEKGVSVTAGSHTITIAGAQGDTSAFNYTAKGNSAATDSQITQKENGTTFDFALGGKGVSGGYMEGGNWYASEAGDGEKGKYAFGSSSFSHSLGAGYRFAASGGGGAGYNGTTIEGVAGTGGTSGGGKGGAYKANGKNATANSGSGGGGAGGNGGTYGAGSSGVVIIRNAR